MGGSTTLDGYAMREVAGYLDAAAASLEVISSTWPEPDEPFAQARELQVETARLWVASVVARVQVWAEHADRIAAALDRAPRDAVCSE